ncbi:MAG TPA: WYL domain-containing protein [Ktedonobacteraceae bacterium]
MSRLERLLELLLRLRALQRFTVQELADDFGVSRRTMLRDLQALSAMGVPLEATPGPGGGYVLILQQRSLPLFLTNDEALGVVLAYESLLTYAAAPFTLQSSAAVTKLRSQLPSEVRQQLDEIRPYLAILHAQCHYTAPFLADLLQASKDQAHLLIRYDSRSQVAERLIYPFGVYAYNGLWYCACFDYKRQQHVSLRADRVIALQRAEGHQRPEQVSLREWLAKGEKNTSQALLLKAHLTPKGVSTVDWADFGGHITVDEQGSGTIEMPMGAHDLTYYAHTFLMLGTDARVESPSELIAQIRMDAQTILKHYGDV